MTWVCLKWGTQTSLYHHVPYENCRFWGSRCIESPAYSRYVLATCWTMTITGGWGGAGLYCCATCTYLYIIILYIYAYIHNSIFIMSIIHIYVKISKSMDGVPHQRRLAKAFLWEINGTDFLGTVWKIRETRPLYDGWFKQSGCSLSSANIGQRQLQRLSLSSETETRCDSS